MGLREELAVAYAEESPAPPHAYALVDDLIPIIERHIAVAEEALLIEIRKEHSDTRPAKRMGALDRYCQERERPILEALADAYGALCAWQHVKVDREKLLPISQETIDSVKNILREHGR